MSQVERPGERPQSLPNLRVKQAGAIFAEKTTKIFFDQKTTETFEGLSHAKIALSKGAKISIFRRPPGGRPTSQRSDPGVYLPLSTDRKN